MSPWDSFGFTQTFCSSSLLSAAYWTHLPFKTFATALIENRLKITSKRNYVPPPPLPKCIRVHVSLPRDTDGLLRARPTCKWRQYVSYSVYIVCCVQLWTLKVSEVCLNKAFKRGRFLLIELKENLGERSWEWIEFSLRVTTTGCNLFIYLFIPLFICLFPSRALLLIPFSYITSCH